MIKTALKAFAVTIGLTSALTAGTIDEIKERGVFLVGAEAKNPPAVYRVDNEIVGYDVDIAKYVADKLGVKLEIVDTAWSGILPALVADKFDAIFSSMSITNARLEKVNYSNPYNTGAMTFLVYADSGIVTAADMSGKTLGVAIGAHYIPAFEAYNAQLEAAGKAPIKLQTYDSLSDVLADLQNKRVDAAVERTVTFGLWQERTKQDPANFHNITDLTEIIKTSNVYGAAVPKDNDELLNFINETITEMRENGKLEELQIKWLGAPKDVPLTIPANIP